MPFSTQFLTDATKPIEVKSVNDDLAFVRDLIKRATARLDKTNVEIYLHGSYANQTNVYFPSNVEICVELKIPAFQYKLTHEYFINHHLEYTAKKFRDDLSMAIVDVFNGGEAVEITDKTIFIRRHGNLKHNIEIVPCLSLEFEHNGGVFAGIMLYDYGIDREIASFPRLHQKNGQLKDLRTTGNFKKMVRLFKTMRTIMKRNGFDDANARGYFIECLLYNVPDNLFLGANLNDVFLKIMNYLMHTGISKFACQNEIWHLFGKAREFWNTQDANHFIRIMKFAYLEFDETRTTVAQQS